MNRRLKLVDLHQQRALDKFLSDQALDRAPSNGPLCVPGNSDGKHHYLLLAEWLDRASPDTELTASLLIYEPRLARQLSHELLVRLYGLTKMESQLVGELFQIPVLQVAAERCGVALNTAKTHLKHVFVKCGVSSKAELLRLLALGPRTL
ncbi:MAG: hypothetical protein WD793_02140 [Steroidobacteraceae bacterium]